MRADIHYYAKSSDSLRFGIYIVVSADDGRYKRYISQKLYDKKLNHLSALALAGHIALESIKPEHRDINVNFHIDRQLFNALEIDSGTGKWVRNYNIKFINELRESFKTYKNIVLSRLNPSSFGYQVASEIALNGVYDFKD